MLPFFFRLHKSSLPSVQQERPQQPQFLERQSKAWQWRKHEVAHIIRYFGLDSLGLHRAERAWHIAERERPASWFR
jgi:hypothetical protein